MHDALALLPTTPRSMPFCAGQHRHLRVLDAGVALLLAFSLMPTVRALLIAISAAFVLTACTAVSPPIQEMTDARLAIIAASDADAETHAPDRLVEARLLLKSAEDNLERRAYTAARRDANLAKAMATEARVVSEGRTGKPAGPDRMPEQPLK